MAAKHLRLHVVFSTEHEVVVARNPGCGVDLLWELNADLNSFRKVGVLICCLPLQ